jgi:hypothetical protein
MVEGWNEKDKIGGKDNVIEYGVFENARKDDRSDEQAHASG